MRRRLDQFQFDVISGPNLCYVVSCKYRKFQSESLSCAYAIVIAMHTGFPVQCHALYITHLIFEERHI